MKRKYLVYLICLLLLVAAVDTIPDPPAFNPPRSHSNIILSLRTHSSSAAPEEGRFVTRGSPRSIPLLWYSLRVDSEDGVVGIFPAALVRHAADPSPPISEISSFSAVKPETGSIAHKASVLAAYQGSSAVCSTSEGDGYDINAE